MLKNAYFYEKKCKNRLSVEGGASERPLAFVGWELRAQTPVLLLPSIVTTLSSSFLALNAFVIYKKRKM